MSQYILPNKISTYLHSLKVLYQSDKKKELLEKIISGCRVLVCLEESSDSWNNESIGHGVKLFVTDIIYAQIGEADYLEKISEQIRNDLRQIYGNSLSNEYIAWIQIEIGDERDKEYNNSFNPFGMSKILHEDHGVWEKGKVRCFISHKDKFKKEAGILAEQLKLYGISSFVAHKNIETNKTWRQEIIKALLSMDFMIAFITEDFFNSTWTNQEIGFAYAREILIIPLKLHTINPAGFIDELQASDCQTDFAQGSFDQIAYKVFHVLSKRWKGSEKLKDLIINSFVNVKSYRDVREIFNQLKQISKVMKFNRKEIQIIIDGFNKNPALQQAFYLTNSNRFTDFLQKQTGKEYEIKNSSIRIKNDLDDDIPF